MARPRRPGLLYLVGGFLVLIALGTLLLLLPVSTRAGGETDFLAALFTATSAVCVTGLVVVDTKEHWTPFGQGVILVLIQLGGLGFMTSSTLLLLLLGRRLSLRQRMITGESIGRLSGERLTHLVRRIVVFTLATEAIGALVLVGLFVERDGLSTHNAWRGLFTAVSAFNNAGFDVEGGFASLSAMAGDPPVPLAVAVLTVLGALGYAAAWDIGRHRRWHPLALNTKVILATSSSLLVLGTVVLLLARIGHADPFDGMSPLDAGVNALAESAYSRTSGFSSIDLSRFGGGELLFLSGLMFIGGAPASTASGIKVTTFSVLGFAILSSLRGDEYVTVFEREIPWRQVNRAISVALLSVAVVFVLVFALSMTTDAPFAEVMFEAISAFANVGLSTGVTRELSHAGELILVIGMFVGRLGPLTVALALARQFERPQRLRYAEEDLAIG